MLECLILGDSIAVGTHMFKKECVSYSKGGWNSWQYNRDYKNQAQEQSAKSIIISLGSNDHKGIKTYNELYKLREGLKGQKVFWILPNPELFARQADDVKLIAISFGDTVIDTQRYQKDNIHPSWAGYKELVEKSRY
jgi:lysophospholipase L1-like esterase